MGLFAHSTTRGRRRLVTNYNNPYETVRAGVVVAGGRSTRFEGEDKALAELNGTPLIRRVADRMADAVDELVVNCRREQVESIRDALGNHDPRFAVDPVPDRGPVAGLQTGLSVASAEYAVATPCDMPFVDPGFVSYLFERARGHAGAVPIANDRTQPLCGVYRVESGIEACEDVLKGGSRRLGDVLARLEPVVIEEATVRAHTAPETFENLNTRADLAAATTHG